VSVADSEADLYDLFVESQKHPTPADFVIRAKDIRCTPDRAENGGQGEFHKVADLIAESPLLGRRVIDLPKTPKREARRAMLEIRTINATLKPPHTKGGLPQVPINAVLLEEIDGRAMRRRLLRDALDHRGVLPYIIDGLPGRENPPGNGRSREELYVALQDRRVARDAVDICIPGVPDAFLRGVVRRRRMEIGLKNYDERGASVESADAGGIRDSLAGLRSARRIRCV